MRGYWSQARTQPLANLAFVLPLLAAYELGLVALGPDALRNGADAWLRRLLDLAGFGEYFLLPLLTCGLLLAWHHLERQPWRIRWTTCYGMLIESILFAVLLLNLAYAQSLLFARLDAPLCATGGAAATWSHLIGYLGAGIYEELLFRLILMSLLAGAAQLAGASPRLRWTLALLVSSLLFAAAHYQLEFSFASANVQLLAYGDAFDWFSFTFRFLAGAVFGLLFLLRGFGIAVGAHALYDVLAWM